MIGVFGISLLFFLSIYECRDISIVNNCPIPVWPAIQGPGNPEGGGFKLDPFETKIIQVSDKWIGGKIWARTQCDSKMNCKTGGCGNSVGCNGTFGKAPMTVAELSLRGSEKYDSYSVSLENGFNLPILIQPATGEDSCERAGGCVEDVNLLCPESHIAARNDYGRPVGCLTDCLVHDTDRSCCRGKYATHKTCKLRKNMRMFKKSCPNNRIHSYESKNKFQCSKSNYIVQIC